MLIKIGIISQLNNILFGVYTTSNILDFNFSFNINVDGFVSTTAFAAKTHHTFAYLFVNIYFHLCIALFSLTLIVSNKHFTYTSVIEDDSCVATGRNGWVQAPPPPTEDQTLLEICANPLRSLWDAIKSKSHKIASSEDAILVLPSVARSRHPPRARH